MGFFNAVRDRFLGKRMEIQAKKKTLKTYENPYKNLGSYYNQLSEFNGSENPKKTK
jgi:hypothetical protein